MKESMTVKGDFFLNLVDDLAVISARNLKLLHQDEHTDIPTAVFTHHSPTFHTCLTLYCINRIFVLKC